MIPAFADLDRIETGRAAGINYLRRAGRGKTLLCLHGLGSWARSFMWPLPHLPKDWDVIAWEAPGYSGSERVAPAWPDEDDYADAAARLLDALGIRRAVVVGHSMGTVIGARFAARHAERTEALILAATALGRGIRKGSPLPESLVARLRAVEIESPAAFARKSAPRLLADPEGRPEALARAIAATSAVTLPGYGQAVRMLASASTETSLRRVTAPTGFICGSRDIIAPRDRTDRAMAARGGEPPLRILPGAGHAMHTEVPDAFAIALSNLVDELTAPQPVLLAGLA